jgi:hypothetical protein
MAATVGCTRPDRLMIWPLGTRGFAIDVRWSGGEDNRRATIVRRVLVEAGIRVVDAARQWPRVGATSRPGADVARVIDKFVW